MFEKFTEGARKAMNLARAEAQRYNSKFLGTEHILLGVVQVAAGNAAKVLKTLDVHTGRVRQEIERLIPPNQSPTVILGHIPFSPRAKVALELAQEASIQLGHDVIGTEHCLIGLLKEHDGIAAMVLKLLGVDLNDARVRIGLESGTGSASSLRPFLGRISQALDDISAILDLAEKGEISAPKVERAQIDQIRSRFAVLGERIDRLGTKG